MLEFDARVSLHSLLLLLLLVLFFSGAILFFLKFTCVRAQVKQVPIGHAVGGRLFFFLVSLCCARLSFLSHSSAGLFQKIFSHFFLSSWIKWAVKFNENFLPLLQLLNCTHRRRRNSNDCASETREKENEKERIIEKKQRAHLISQVGNYFVFLKYLFFFLPLFLLFSTWTSSERWMKSEETKQATFNTWIDDHTHRAQSLDLIQFYSLFFWFEKSRKKRKKAKKTRCVYLSLTLAKERKKITHSLIHSIIFDRLFAVTC